MYVLLFSSNNSNVTDLFRQYRTVIYITMPNTLRVVIDRYSNRKAIDSNCAMFRRHLMESVSVFAVGKRHFSRSGSDSLDKTAVEWKVCHAGSDRSHTTQPFLSDCHFLSVLYTIRQVAHIQYDLGALSQHMPCRYISCKQL